MNSRCGPVQTTLALLVMFIGALSCPFIVLSCIPTEPEIEPVDVPQPVEGQGPTSSSDEELDQLRILGYVDVAEKEIVPTSDGVSHFDALRSQPGYTLFNQSKPKAAYLINAQGEVIHQWTGKGEGHWSRVRLLPNGDLLIIGSYKNRTFSAEYAGRYIQRQSWGGDEVWKRDLPLHHDLFITPDNQLISLAMKLESVPLIHKTEPVRVDYVVDLSMDGDVLKERSLLEVRDSRPELLIWKPISPRVWSSDDPRRYVDLFHANSVNLMTNQTLANQAPFYALGGRLVTLRHQDVIMLYSEPKGVLSWVWGRGVLDHPHDAQVLDNGHLLIFDNGLKRGWSRIIELDPITMAIVWEYKAENPTDFFTRGRGNAQRLANGNTLICQSNSGRLFEVTPAGEVVWQYMIPTKNDKGNRLIIGRVWRYDSDFIESLLNDGLSGKEGNPQ